MKENIINNVSSLFIFIFVFSFFNDNYMVNHFGENSLKLLFVIFFICYGPAIIKSIKTMSLFQDKIFFSYAISLTIIFLLERIFVDWDDNPIPKFMVLLALFGIVIYFSRYPLEKLLYFIWISMMLSVVMAFFNESMTEWTFRKSGGTSDPNEFSAQLLAFLFSSIYLFRINKSKIFFLITVLFFAYGIFTAGSKSAFLMLFIVGILTIFKYLIFDIKKIVNYRLLLILAVFLVVASQIEFTKIQAIKNMQTRAKSSHTLDTRMASWEAGYYMTSAHPIMGVGLNKYGEHTQQYATIHMAEGSTAPHNIYVKLVAESGLVVFLIFLIFLIFLLAQNFKFAIRSNVFWLYMAFLSLLFMGMTLGINYDKYFLLYIAIMLNTNYLIRTGKMYENITHRT